MTDVRFSNSNEMAKLVDEYDLDECAKCGRQLHTYKRQPTGIIEVIKAWVFRQTFYDSNVLTIRSVDGDVRGMCIKCTHEAFESIKSE